MRVSRESCRSVTHAAFCAASLTCFVDQSTVKADDRQAPAPETPKTVLFGSLDACHSGFGTVGVKRTLHGSLDHSGVVGLASLGYGRTIERAWEQPEAPRFTRHAVLGSALLGYQWVGDGIVLAALAGPGVEGERSDRLVRQSTEAHLGARLHGEVWAHPTASTLLTTTVIVGTARTAHLWARASAGYALWEGVFVGPEASVYTTDTYREWRLGAHVTGLSVGRLGLRLSAGWRGEEDADRAGAYVGLAGHIKM